MDGMANTLIGGIALIYSILCFFLFWKAATKPPSDEAVKTIAAEAAKSSSVKGIAPIGLGDLGKFVGEVVAALKDAAPTIITLVGALLFLLLSGAALGVYSFGSAPKTAATPTPSPTSSITPTPTPPSSAMPASAASATVSPTG